MESAQMPNSLNGFILMVERIKEARLREAKEKSAKAKKPRKQKKR
jgi:hypothetical protein